jgi:two-component system, NtrC family, response regulator AlgB
MNRSANPTTPPLSILVADDDAAARTSLMLVLEQNGHQVVGTGNVYDALAEASWRAFDLIFLGSGSQADALTRLREECPGSRLVLVGTSPSAASANGAADYLTKPLSPAHVQSLARRVAEARLLTRRATAFQRSLDALDPLREFVANSPAMARTMELARTAANSQAAVLIRGEIGAGKGHLARAIHAASTRAAAPMLIVSCRAESADALGADLFGVARQPCGCVEQCEGGTLVLDGVSELSAEIQVKVLRLMREREYERHDDFRPRPANVRIIATTHVDLESLARRGKFRADLLSALETVRIDLPPLRHRTEDIAPLAERFADYFCREMHRPAVAIEARAMQVLCEHRWPGNVRELRNVIERAVLMSRAAMPATGANGNGTAVPPETIGIELLPANLLNSAASSPPAAASVGDLVSLETIEQLHIRKVVDSMPTISSAAAVLGVHPGTVLRRLKKSEAAGAAAAAAPTLHSNDAIDESRESP